MSNKILGIPDAPLGSENKPILDAMKVQLETISGIRGTVDNRGITVQDLIDLGLIEEGDMDKVLRNRT